MNCKSFYHPGNYSVFASQQPDEMTIDCKPREIRDNVLFAYKDMTFKLVKVTEFWFAVSETKALPIL